MGKQETNLFPIGRAKTNMCIGFFIFIFPQEIPQIKPNMELNQLQTLFYLLIIHSFIHHLTKELTLASLY